jgi:hypothetical protein
VALLLHGRQYAIQAAPQGQRFAARHPRQQNLVRCGAPPQFETPGIVLENRHSTTLRFLEIFRSDHYADVSLSQWLAFTPHKLVRAHLNVEVSVLDKGSERKTPVVAGEIRTKA